MPDSYWSPPDEEMRLLRAATERRATYARLVGTLPVDQAERASTLLRRHPNMSAGFMQALAQAPQPQEMEDLLADEDEGNWFDSVRGVTGDALGDVVDFVTSTVDTSLDNLYERGIKPIIRGVTVLSDTLAQELVQRPLTAGLAAAQGEAGFGEAYRDYGDSAGLNLITGDLDDEAEGGLLGKGFFAGGRAGKEATDERTLQVNGQTANLGRAFAGATVGSFSDPGDRLYDLVAGVTGFAADVGLDPLAWLTGGSSVAARGAARVGASTATQTAIRGGATGALRQARRLDAGEANQILQAAGAIQGTRRNTVLVERASDFFRNPELLEQLAKADSFDIARGWRKSPANRLDGEMIRNLGNAKTQEEVAEHLLGAVAHGDVTQLGTIRGQGRFVREHRFTGGRVNPLKFLGPDGKLSGISPGGVVSAGSADELWTSAEKVDSFLRQANMDREFRRGVFNRVTTLADGDFAGLFTEVTGALDEVGKKLGGDEMTSLREVAQKYQDEVEAFRKYGVDSWGGPIDVPYAPKKMKVEQGGVVTEVPVPTPHITSELNSLALHLPDVADVRRAATKLPVLKQVYTSKGWEVTADAARSVTQGLFKPAAILRPAYVVRIGAEEQARLTAAGYDSLYNHPFRWLMGNVLNRDAMNDLVGEDLTAVARAQDVITKDAHALLPDRSSQARVFGTTNIKLDDADNLTKDAYRGWKGELGQISAAPEARKMAELVGNQTLFKEWAQSDGIEYITKLSRINDEAKSLLDFGADFDQWAGSLAQRVQMKTGGQLDASGQVVGGWDADIIDRVVRGDIPLAHAGGRQARNADATFASFLSGKARQGVHPGMVKVEHIDEGRKAAMDRGIDTLFDVITGRPTSRLARFPTFRQAMIRRGTELMDGLADDALRMKVLESFETNMKLSKEELRSLSQAAQDGAGATGAIGSVEDFNEILKIRAAQDAKDLLFDVTKRGAGQEAMVAVLPFLDAWKEVSLTWARLLKDNPAFFVRAQAGYRELKEQGTFYANQYGQETFRYPGGGLLSTFVDEMNQRGGGLQNLPMAAVETVGRFATGDTPDYSVAPEGSVAGLNMIATGVGPGFGPIVQWGATAFDTPDTRKLREFIAPFGTGANDDPEDLLNFGGLVGGFMPAWARKAFNAVSEGGIDERQWNGMVGDSMAALVASGDYDPADSDRLLEDAQRMAEYQLLFRAGTQFAGPTGAGMSQEAAVDADTKHEDWDPENDPTGRMFFLGVMREDYFRLSDTYGFDVAAEKFYEMYGIEPFYVTQAKTNAGGRELPVSREGDDWMQANRDVVEDFGLVAGFFAPTDEEPTFDFSVYSEQLLRGERRSLTPQEQQAMAAKARARAIWARVQAQTENLPRSLRETARQQAKGQLEALHPGWQADVIMQPNAGSKIAQLERAALDPRLDDNPVTQSLRDYLALRGQALQRVRLRSGSASATLGRQEAAIERSQLMQAGLALASRNPSFMGVWSSLLKNELSED